MVRCPHGLLPNFQKLLEQCRLPFLHFRYFRILTPFDCISNISLPHKCCGFGQPACLFLIQWEWVRCTVGQLGTAGLGQLVQSLILAGQLPGDLLQRHISAQAAVIPLYPVQPLLHLGPCLADALLRLRLNRLGAAVGLQLDTGGAVLHLLIGRRRRPSLGQLFLALLSCGAEADHQRA